MTPERWKRVEVLFETAASMSPPQRRRFLARACRGDEELQREVEAMLRWDERAERFLETPLAGFLEGPPSQEAGSPAPLLAPGEEIGPYRILALRGVGGMAEVYSALDTRLDRMVAIKLLSRPLTARSEALVRFHREALAVSALSHPHISTLHDIGDYKGRPFLVMELIEGQTLKQRLAGGALPEPELLSAGMQAASALAAVHAKGIVHRDIKPANIFLTSDGVVKIVDFGIAKLLAGRADAGTDEAETPSADTLEVTLTEPGKLVGTAPYMAPEQILGFSPAFGVTKK